MALSSTARLSGRDELCNNVIHVHFDFVLTMTLTVRLAPHLHQQLESYCKKRRLSKSRVVTDLLSEHLSASLGSGRTPYQLAREFGLIGGFASGKGDLAEKRKRYLADKLRAKRPR
jgi:hypothetical protein